MGLIKALLNFGKTKKKKINYLAKIKTINLPNSIEKLPAHSLRKVLKNELKTYTSLNYSASTPAKLEERNYHSFQIGALIRALKIDMLESIEAGDNIFPEIVRNLNYYNLSKRAFTLVKKFDSDVDKNLTEQQLKAHIIWTPFQASIILYMIHKLASKL